jgi:hypothetical protein
MVVEAADTAAEAAVEAADTNSEEDTKLPSSFSFSFFVNIFDRYNRVSAQNKTVLGNRGYSFAN